MPLLKNPSQLRSVYSLTDAVLMVYPAKKNAAAAAKISRGLMPGLVGLGPTIMPLSVYPIQLLNVSL